jgi:hypothetical protein
MKTLVKGVQYIIEDRDCPNAHIYTSLFGKRGWPGLNFNKVIRYKDAVLFLNDVSGYVTILGISGTTGAPDALLGYHERGEIADPFFWDDEFGPDWIQDFVEMVK